MKSNLFHVQVIGLFVLTLIPWPGPTVFKISCPRDNARIVRKIIQHKWTPVLQKYRVTIPLECPFHPARDIFGPQQTAKQQHRHSQWTCGLCGKSFFEERYLDMHFDNRHKNHINMAEDAVCLADYCDIMRCDVLRSQDPYNGGGGGDGGTGGGHGIGGATLNTDIDVWREGGGDGSAAAAATAAYTRALATSGPRDVARYTLVRSGAAGFKRATLSPDKGGGSKRSGRGGVHHCRKSEAPTGGEDSGGNNKSETGCEKDLVDAALPAPDNKQQRIAELQKLKANCKPEDLQKIKTKCEILVRDCIASLLIQLSIKDFKEVEDELNRAVCWYLTCDRYWEDSQTEIRSFPWGLLCMIIMVLSLGICLCYYIIWVLFDTDDASVTTSTSLTDRSTPSPAHALRHHEASTSSEGHLYSEDYYNTVDKDNEYIYVTYPPDLKRRLLERLIQNKFDFDDYSIRWY